MLVALSVLVVLGVISGLRMPEPGFAPSLVRDAMVPTSPPRPLVALASVDADGGSLPFNRRVTRPTVISFWATWCQPCLHELPSLGQFKTMAAAAGIDVLTVSEDRGGAGPPVKLLAEKGLSFLPLVVDADGALAQALGIRGMPTMLVVNGRGEEVARMEGGADWSRPESLEAVTGLLAAAAPVR